MAKVLKKVDMVTVGVGFVSGIIAAECTKAGINVVGLERGEYRTTDDFLHIHDEWRYGINYGLMQDLSKETVTFRNDRSMRALPMRKLGSFLLGDGLGGAGVHWNAMTYRFFPYDFQIKTMTEARYGKNKLSKDYLLQDWGLTYQDLEPYYTKFEYMAGVSGEDISPFTPKRSKPYPLKPLAKTPILQKFEQGCKKLGYNPYMGAAAIASDVYTNPDGMNLYPCTYCGYCERFGCEYNAKAMPINTVIPTAMKTGRYELRCNSNVLEILKKGNKAVGVRYINTLTKEEFIQPADIVLLSSYVMNNAKLLMVSKIGQQYDPVTGKGTLGKNYCYQITPGSTGVFKDEMNVYAGAGALGMNIDEFNADNFDHTNLDFIHGGMITMLQSGKRPIAANLTTPGTPAFGAAFKKETIETFNRSLSISVQGASMPHKENYLSLDDTYKDVYGMPLLRMTYNFTDQDRALYKHIVKITADIMKSMGAEKVLPGTMSPNYNIVPYQTTHNAGGTIMGATPENSVVNTYAQHWDYENLFVVGASNFNHQGGSNPTSTAGAIAYKSAEGIIKYHKKGGSLV